MQADFILIYYNNKRTIISFLEALSLYHLNSRQGFVVHQSTGLCRAGLQAQPRAGKGWYWGLGRLKCHLMNPVPSVPRCSTQGWYKHTVCWWWKKPDNVKTFIISLCVAFFYFVRKKKKKNLLLGLYHKWQPRSLLLVYCDFTWCVPLSRFFLCKPVKLTHVLRHVFTMDLEIRDMLYRLSLCQNNGLYVSGAKQDHGSGPF